MIRRRRALIFSILLTALLLEGGARLLFSSWRAELDNGFVGDDWWRNFWLGNHARGLPFQPGPHEYHATRGWSVLPNQRQERWGCEVSSNQRGSGASQPAAYLALSACM